MGDGAMCVSDTNTARTTRNSAIAFRANGSRFGRHAKERSGDHEHCEGTVHEPEPHVVGADISQHEVGHVIAGVGGGKAHCGNDRDETRCEKRGALRQRAHVGAAGEQVAVKGERWLHWRKPLRGGLRRRRRCFCHVVLPLIGRHIGKSTR